MFKMKKLTGSFRYTQWDPCLLTSQIVAIQFIMYLSLCILVAIMQDITGAARTLDHIFEYHVCLFCTLSFTRLHADV